MLPEPVVKQVFSELLDLDEETLTADRRFDEIEQWDSVNALRVLVYLESKLERPIDYHRFMSAQRLGDLWEAQGIAASS